jgi:hypothetical protein
VLAKTIMLKGIHPLLPPDLLHALAAMGHGDEIGVVDANFPAASLGVAPDRAPRRIIARRASMRCSRCFRSTPRRARGAHDGGDR